VNQEVIFMSDQYTNEPLLDMFLFETSQLIEQLEQSLINSEKESDFSEEAINEIFRIMHTIKGSAAMMLFDNIAKLAHSIEDVFFCLRKEKPVNVDYSALTDLIFEGVDFVKIEVDKIINKLPADGNADSLVSTMKDYLSVLKQDIKLETAAEPIPVPEEKQQYYISQVKPEHAEYNNVFKAVIHFEEGCEMENIRAYTIIHNLKEITDEFTYIPSDIIDSDESINVIRRNGFQITLRTDRDYQKIHDFFNQTIFLKDMELVQLEDDSVWKKTQTELILTPPAEAVKVPTIAEGPKEEREDRDRCCLRKHIAEHHQRECSKTGQADGPGR
jgi:two-component system chemotaxis sensor kinase CheA